MAEAQVTDYGWVYQPDGSLSVTVRQDDSAFEGGQSFAVETPTTNLAASTNWFGSPGAIFTRTLMTDGSFKGWYQVHVTQTGNYGYVMSLGNVDATAGATYTWAVDLVTVKSDGNYYARPYLTGSYGRGPAVKLNDIRWYRVDTPTSSGKYGFYIQIFNGVTYIANATVDVVFYYRYYQVEAKSFPTSYTDSNRSITGNLTLPMGSFIDFANDDWVISYWKKPTATHTDDRSGYNICSIGEGGIGQGYIWWGKTNGLNAFYVCVYSSGDTTVCAASTTFDPDWYFNNWHFEVIRKIGTLFEYFVDGAKRVTLSVTPHAGFTDGIRIGGWKTSGTVYASNALFTGIHVGSPYDENGELFWTDEYIQEVYEKREPFKTPPKVAIMT